jgi:hypothetical protein
VGSELSLGRTRYKGWDAWTLNRGALELVLVPQVGGRIMGLRWRGHDFSFAQPERQGVVEDVASVGDVRARKREMGFPLWGGDKTWIGPQHRWTDGVPYLDLDSGAYELAIEKNEPDGVVLHMRSPVCRETGIQVERSIAASAASAEWTVTHRLRNAGEVDAAWAPWDVSMVLRPARVYLPRHPASAHPSGVLTFAHEGESVQARDAVVGELGRLAVIHCEAARAFKYGVDSEEGWMLGVLETSSGGLAGYRKRVAVHPASAYPHGCTAEVYNSDRYPYLEMEIPGPVVKVAPGRTFELEERCAFVDVPRWPESEDEVRGYLAD